MTECRIGPASHVTMKVGHALALALIILIWGSNLVIGKIGVSQIPPIFMMAIRFVLVAVLLSPFLRPIGKPWWQILLLSVTLGGLQFSLMFTGLHGIDAGAASIAVQLYVPFSAMLAWAVFRECLRPQQIGGMLVAFAGAYVLFGAPRVAPNSTSFLLVVAGALMLSIATIQIKRLGRLNVFSLNAWVAVLAAPQLFILSYLLEDGQMAALSTTDWRGWGALAWMVVAVTIVSNGLFYHLINTYPLSKVVPATLLSPVLAVVLAVPVLGEPITLHLVVGGVLTLLGVSTIQFCRVAHAPPPTAEPQRQKSCGPETS
jgi:O-acetylserine/cysteine efflux transporter